MCGSFPFLEGRGLDFGIVRDATTLNAANRFEMFYESFEAVAFVGVESLCDTTKDCSSGVSVAAAANTKCDAFQQLVPREHDGPDSPRETRGGRLREV